MEKRRGLDVIDEKQQQQVENTKHTHTYKSLLYRLFHDCRINPVFFRHRWFLITTNRTDSYFVTIPLVSCCPGYQQNYKIC